MPNWVQNTLVARDSELLKELLLDENGDVDFNKILPMPQDLHISSGSNSYDEPCRYDFGTLSESANQRVMKQLPIEEFLKVMYNKHPDISQADFVELAKKNPLLVEKVLDYKGWEMDYAMTPPDSKWDNDTNTPFETYVKGFFNIQRYGHRDWYNWSVDVWGTKWNGSETYVDGDKICFQTAWSMPEGVIRELAKHTPIRAMWADEDLGSNNCGIYDFFFVEGGVQEECVKEPSEFMANAGWDNEYITVWDDETYEPLDEDDERFIKANEGYNDFVAEIYDLMTAECLSKDFLEV